MRDNVERWLIHEELSFEEIKGTAETFQIRIKHAGPYGIPTEVFEPKGQPGVLVIGAKAVMKNNQIVRYRGFNVAEKKRFEEKVADFCNSIRVVHKIIAEDGKQKIGVYVVLDDTENINQQTLLEAIDNVSEKYEKTTRFLMKTF